MEIYILSASSISPQNTFEPHTALEEMVVYYGNRLSCIEPEYKDFIDPKLIRRMSRIIKMGVAAAVQCLKNAQVQMPDAIITGTAYGCLEDTGVFLSKMVEQQEELLTPTAFIQSTHNTVAAQIALMLHCHHYNNSFVHRGFSFESALMDAIMLLNENAADNVLVGGVDEITDISHKILSRFGLYKKESIANRELFNTSTHGTVAGEAASFFVFSNTCRGNSIAKIQALKTFYKPSGMAETENQIQSFLNREGLKKENIDLLIFGNNGDLPNDKIYHHIENKLFQGINTLNYKHLCGEFPTAVAFALWLTVFILKGKKLPGIFSKPTFPAPKTVLIYNHYMNIHHTLLLVSAC